MRRCLPTGVLFLILSLTFAVRAVAEQVIGPAALAAARDAGITPGIPLREKIARALTLVNVRQYVHEHESAVAEEEPPPGGTHPYEWDSLRTSEQMLRNRDGGSCGTHGLSLAAILRAAGVASRDLRLIGGVNLEDYIEICPGKAGEKRAPGVHGASGHVFLAVRISGHWRLINTTHDPFEDPISGKSAAERKFRSLAASCKKRDRACIHRARSAAAPLLLFEDFESIPYGDPGALDLSGKRPPTFLPTDRFPSLAEHMGEPGAPPPPMIAFSVWSFEDYPRHTILGRDNMVASGRADREVCRWAGRQLAAPAQTHQHAATVSQAAHL